MTNPPAVPAVHGTFVIERKYPRSPARVFALLATASAKRAWYLDGGGSEVESFTMDFQVGGAERARYVYRNGSPVDGLPFVNDGIFLDIVTDRRVIIASAMSVAGHRISASLVTFELAPTGSGTTLTLTHQGVFLEGSDGPVRRKHGWTTLLESLATALADEPSR